MKTQSWVLPDPSDHLLVRFAHGDFGSFVYDHPGEPSLPGYVEFLQSLQWMKEFRQLASHDRRHRQPQRDVGAGGGS